MKSIHPFLLIIALATSALAQTTLTGSVYNGAGKPLPFTPIALLSGQDSSLVKGVVSQENGSYEIDNIRPGRYKLMASAVGYAPVRSRLFDVLSTATQAPAIILNESVKTLGEVTVAAQKPVFEQQLDKLVVNVQSIVTAAGSSALDVLERSPGITVNRQSNALTMAGKSGVVIMINGKISAYVQAIQRIYG